MDATLLKETFYDVPRSALEVDPSKNSRRYYGDKEKLGASLNRGQTSPLICIPTGKKRPKWSVRDGFRRVKASDEGYCPVFTKRNKWWIVVLMRPDGSAPSEEEVQQYCATTNTIRENWTEIEEAWHYNRQVMYALDRAKEEANGNLGQREEGRVRSAAIARLAEENNITTRTVRYRLKLLELPEDIQDQLARGNTTVTAVKELLDSNLDDDEKLRVIQEAATIDRVDLGGTQLPGDQRLEVRRPSTRRVSSGNREGDREAIGRIQVATVRQVIERKTKTPPKPKLRPITWFIEEIERVTPMAKGSDKKAEKAKIYLQALRAAIGDTDKTPV